MRNKNLIKSLALNKKGVNQGLWILLLLLVAIGVLFYNVGGLSTGFANTLKFQTASVNPTPSTGANSVGGVATLPSAQCNPAPSITLQYIDQLGGKTLSPNNTAIINGGSPFNLSGTALGQNQIANGQQVQLLLQNVNYPSQIVPTFTVTCSNNPVSGKLLSQYSPGLSVIGSQGTVLSNGFTLATNDTGGGTNSVTQKLRIIPTAFNGTGNLVVVADINSSTIIQSVTVGGFALYNGGSKPNNYVPQATASKITTFIVPNSLTEVDVPVTFSPASGQTIANLNINYTVYTAQDIQDVNGAFVPQRIEDSNGNAKWFNVSSTVDHIT